MELTLIMFSIFCLLGAFFGVLCLSESSELGQALTSLAIIVVFILMGCFSLDQIESKQIEKRNHEQTQESKECK